MDAKILTNIKDVLKNHPHNTVLTAKELLRLGFSRDLQRSAVRSGWLTRFGTGAYTMLNQPVTLEGAVHTLQKELGLSVHLGAYTILNEKYGKTHNIGYVRKPQLFAYRGERVPAWFNEQYDSRFDLFVTSFLPPKLGFTEYDYGNFSIQIPVVERAILEMLYLTPSIHTLQETYQVLELLTTVKPALLQKLLECCNSVKVKRLFFYMADNAGLAWFDRLNLNTIDLGKGEQEITRGGRYDKKYRIVIGNIEDI